MNKPSKTRCVGFFCFDSVGTRHEQSPFVRQNTKSVYLYIEGAPCPRVADNGDGAPYSYIPYRHRYTIIQFYTIHSKLT